MCRAPGNGRSRAQRRAPARRLPMCSPARGTPASGARRSPHAWCPLAPCAGHRPRLNNGRPRAAKSSPQHRAPACAPASGARTRQCGVPGDARLCTPNLVGVMPAPASGAACAQCGASGGRAAPAPAPGTRPCSTLAARVHPSVRRPREPYQRCVYDDGAITESIGCFAYADGPTRTGQINPSCTTDTPYGGRH